MIILPSLVSALVDKAGRMLPPWNSFFQQFTSAPAPAIPVTVGASPFNYTAREPGNMLIIGGTVTGVHILRGTDYMDVTGSKIVPLLINDLIEVLYTVAPTMMFLPSLGPVPR